jgi:hypothetical protein
MVQMFYVTRALSRLSGRLTPCSTVRVRAKLKPGRLSVSVAFRQGLLGQRDTALAPRPIHNACRLRQSAEF